MVELAKQGDITIMQNVSGMSIAYTLGKVLGLKLVIVDTTAAPAPFCILSVNSILACCVAL